MKKSLQYILYYIICITLLIIALIFFWWFTGKPYTKENFVTPAPYMVLVGLTATGDVYYADVDVPMAPKWVKNTGISGVGDIAGSYGTLYTTGTTTAAGPIKYGAYDSGTQTTITGTATQIAADDATGFAVLSGTSMSYSPTNTGPINTTTTVVKNMSISNGGLYTVDTNNWLVYSPTTATTTWTTISKTSTSTTAWKQVSFDNQVCAVDNAGYVWCADKNVANDKANWTQQGLQKFNQICLKGERMVGVGTDNKVYYADYYTTDLTSPVRWQVLPTQPYTTAGVSTGTPVTFKKVILMFPAPYARRRRFKSSGGSGSACNSNEELIEDSTGSYCYQMCPSGRPATGKTCPYRAKYIAATPNCPGETGVKGSGKGVVEFINDSCYQECPDGYTASGDICLGATTNKGSSALKGSTTTPNYTPANENCPADGSVSGRYVRIRPTKLIDNNKLCIQKLVVKDSAGTVLTNTVQVPTPTGFSSDETSSGVNAPLTGATGTYYLSGYKWDKDPDGGTINRSANLYWEVDLGEVKKIKTIEFTPCNYVPQSGAVTAGSGKSLPNADQITGMTVEVLNKSNEPATVPIASRSLGPSKGGAQVITFNYVLDDENLH